MKRYLVVYYYSMGDTRSYLCEDGCYSPYIESAKKFNNDRQAIEYLLMLPNTESTIYLMENIWVKI